MNSPLPCPCCGAVPNISSTSEQYGQGSSGFKYFVECKCGMQTKGFDDYTAIEEQCKARAIAVWNARAPKVARMSIPLTIGRAYTSGGFVPGARPPQTIDLPGERRIPCPADPAPSAEPGLPSGQPSPGPEREDFQTLLLSSLLAQTEAINRLAQSNQALVQAMAQGEGADEDDPERPQYLGRVR